MVVQARDPEIRACRVESFRSFHSSRCVTRLLSNPRREADPLEALGTMPDDAQERLRKSLQSCLRQTLLHLVTVLDTSEVGTSKLLSVPIRQLRTLVPSSNVEGAACAEQWSLLAEALGEGQRASRRRNSVVSGVLKYEPNLRLQALPTVVHCPFESVVLRCTECSHPMSSSWFFVHPRTGRTQVLMPHNGHNDCRRLCKRVCYFRSEQRRESILDVLTCLDFCVHARARRMCAQCGGSACCVHGKQRYWCAECAHLVKRRKKLFGDH